MQIIMRVAEVFKNLHKDADGQVLGTVSEKVLLSALPFDPDSTDGGAGAPNLAISEPPPAGIPVRLWPPLHAELSLTVANSAAFGQFTPGQTVKVTLE